VLSAFAQLASGSGVELSPIILIYDALYSTRISTSQPNWRVLRNYGISGFTEGD